LLGYLQRDGKLYLADRDMSVVAYSLSLTQVEFETLVTRGDVDAAMDLLSDIPADNHNKIARFLEGAGFKELALDVATDPEHKFELGLGLNRLDICLDIAKEEQTEHKWKALGDAALAQWNMQLAQQCFVESRDQGSLLLLHSSSGDKAALAELAKQAEETGSNNIAYSALWLCGDKDGCIDLLKRTGRMSEAVLFSQTYKPSRCPQLVQEWKEGLEKQGKSKVGRLIGVPGQDDDLFPEWDEYIKLEEEGGKGDVGESVVEVDGEKSNDASDGVADTEEDGVKEEEDGVKEEEPAGEDEDEA